MRRETSLPLLRPWRSGFRPRNVLWRRVSSTRGRTSGRHWLRLLSAFSYTKVGWQYAFLGTSAFALIWLVLWLAIYRSPARSSGVSPSELANINSDPAQPAAKIPWSSLLSHRQTWAFLGGKVMTDPIWWFYLYWLPGFLSARFGLTITKMGLPLLVIYNVCTFGSIFGG